MITNSNLTQRELSAQMQILVLVNEDPGKLGEITAMVGERLNMETRIEIGLF